MTRNDARRTESFLGSLRPLQGLLEAYARRAVRRPADAEDALQEAMLKAFRDYDRFTEGTNFRAWAFKYLTLEIRAVNRRSRRNEHGVLPFEPPAPPHHPAEHVELERLPDVGDWLLDDCDDELAAAFGQLSEVERSVLLLRALADLKYREIADVLGIPTGTVMSHLSRGRKAIRRRLGDWAARRNLGDPIRADGA